jgi:hypothetical protein
MADLISESDAPSSVPLTRDQDRMRRLADLLDPKETPNWTAREAAHVLCGVDPDRDIRDCVHAETEEVLLRLLPGIEPPSSRRDWADLHRSLSEGVDRLDERLSTIQGLGLMTPLKIVDKLRKAGTKPPWWGLWVTHQRQRSEKPDAVEPCPDGAASTGTPDAIVEMARRGGKKRARKYEGLTAYVDQEVLKLRESQFRSFRKINGSINVAKLTESLRRTAGLNPDTRKLYSPRAVRNRVEKALQEMYLPDQF